MLHEICSIASADEHVLVLFVADVPTTTIYSVDNASSSGTEENSDGTYS